MRASQNDQAEGMIANQLRGDLQQISFGSGAGSVTALSSTVNYYTVEGIQTQLGNTYMPPYYQANFAIQNAGVNGTSFAGSSAVPSNSAVVTVTLTYPYPARTQTNVFSLLETKQTGL